MDTLFTVDDKVRIRRDIERKYQRVADTPNGQFKYPTGREALETLGYDPSILNVLPGEVADSYCGTGNPFSLGKIEDGEIILDFGCGAGVDSLFAAKMTGDRGRVVGIDIVPEMLERAVQNRDTLGLTNIEFKLSRGEILEFPDEHFDTIISNSVINLIPEKESILQEFFRCLKPGGKLLLVDQIFTGEQIKEHAARVKSWFQWEGGAVPEKVFLEMLKITGFNHIKAEGYTGFNSSPRTKGTLISGKKPTASECCKPEELRDEGGVAAQGEKEFKVEALLEEALELGCEEAKLIETETIAVGNWVRWKCLYGCPLYRKDGCHPPYAPGVEETRKILKEYSKAVLIKGYNGTKLSEDAIKLERFAYEAGCYKAFALIALPPAPGETWCGSEEKAQGESKINSEIRPMLEACGIDVFKTVRDNGFKLSTTRDKNGRWSFFAILLVE